MGQMGGDGNVMDDDFYVCISVSEKCFVNCCLEKDSKCIDNNYIPEIFFFTYFNDMSRERD